MNPGSFDFKESFTNFDKAMKGIPERVPVFAQIHEFTMSEIGFSAKDFYTDPRNLVYGLLEIHKKYNLDAPCVDYDVYNIEAEGIGQKVTFNDNNIPDVDRSNYLIKTRDDLKKIKTPDFNNSGRFRFALDTYGYFYEMTGEYSPLNFCAPFSLAANIRGIENLIFDILERQEFARELFERLTNEVVIPWVTFLHNEYPDSPSIVGSDATASLPILNIEMLEEWVIPYILKIREAIGDKVYVSNWVGDRYLKNPERLFYDKLKVCPNFLEGQDPDVEYIGPETYKRFVSEHNVSLVLGVGAAFLANSAPKQVEERVKKYLLTGKPGGKFALYLCNIGKTTPKENLITAVNTVHKYGLYS